MQSVVELAQLELLFSGFTRLFCDVSHILRNGNNMVVVVRCQSSLLVADLGGPELTVTEENVEIACHRLYQGLYYSELLSMFKWLDFWQ